MKKSYIVTLKSISTSSTRKVVIEASDLIAARCHASFNLRKKGEVVDSACPTYTISISGSPQAA